METEKTAVEKTHLLLKPMDFCLIYTTAPDRKTAEKLARRLLSLKLIACANCFPEMKSLYRWKGKTVRDTECALLLKTRKSLYKKVEKAIQSAHPYDCPCVLRLPVEGGFVPFLKWIGDSVSASK